MSHPFHMQPNNLSPFYRSVWNKTSNRRDLFLGSGLSLASFIIFRILYPYPDFFSDSYSYLFAAKHGMDVSIWPIGYSKFLLILHFISSSNIVVVALQYFLIQAAGLYLYFTILYFFSTSLWTRRLLFIFLFVNPLTLYLANTINS